MMELVVLELLVKAQPSSKYFVKIQIGPSHNENPKEFFLSRWQFEILFFSIPIILVWGIISTAILLKTLYSERPPQTTLRRESQINPPNTIEKMPLPAGVITQGRAPIAGEPAAGVLKRQSATAPSDTRAITEKTSVPGLEDITGDSTRKPIAADQNSRIQGGSRSFQVEDIFSIDFSIFKTVRNPNHTIRLKMNNLKGSLESGHFWISILARTSNGKKVWLTPTPNVKINESGQATAPNLGPTYSFTKFRRSDFELKTSNLKIRQFEELMIGFERDGKSPTMAKVRLRSR